VRGKDDHVSVDDRLVSKRSQRYLCASAVLEGYAFRRAVLNHFTRGAGAVSPELGVDVDLVVRVSQHLIIRDVWQAMRGRRGRSR